MTKIPNNVMKPPPGYEYVTVEKNIPIVQIKRTTDIAAGDKLTSQDDIKKRIDYLEKKLKMSPEERKAFEEFKSKQANEQEETKQRKAAGGGAAGLHGSSTQAGGSGQGRKACLGDRRGEAENGRTCSAAGRRPEGTGVCNPRYHRRFAEGGRRGEHMLRGSLCGSHETPRGEDGGVREATAGGRSRARSSSGGAPASRRRRR